MPRKKSNRIKTLSVVIPAYKQEKTIIKDILNIEAALKQLKYNYEIIVVVDGFVDQTYKNVLKLKSTNVKIIGYDKNQGKGHAVRYGMMHAKGDIVGFIDAGMDIDLEGFTMLLNHLEWYNADIIVGSKLHPLSQVDYPAYRTVLSWGYRFLTARLFGFKIRDTQVGLKFFKKAVIRDVLPRLLVKRYAFDIEILAVAQSLGYTRIYEAPIKISFKSGSITSKTLWSTVFFMIWDTLAVYYRLYLVGYYKIAKKKRSKKIVKHTLTVAST